MTEIRNRLYNDLSWLWPMWDSPSEYQQYCKTVTLLIDKYSDRELKTLLNVGCGGGKNVFNLKERFKINGLDISRPMLNLASELNPECEFIQKDMRDYDLDRKFDVILIDDAISYMTSENDLFAAFERAYEHLAADGIMLVSPDFTKESFVQNSTQTTHAVPPGKASDIDVVFVENNYDPVTSDTTYEALVIYIIRENGKLRIEKDMHILGLFSINTWRRLLTRVGFHFHEEIYCENGNAYTEFVCLKQAQ